MAPPYSVNTTIADIMPDYQDIIKGKTILTTGVTPGSIGAVFLEAVATASPALLILAGRKQSVIDDEAAKIAAVNASVATRTLVLDLMSLASVRRAAAEVNAWADVPKIDLLVNSAGIMAVPYATTEDGFESQFGTNHVGHFLFTNSIMDKMLAAEVPRVVNVSSNGHHFSQVRFLDPHFSEGKTYNKWMAYGQSKSANILFSVALAEKLGHLGLLAASVHPGAIPTTGLATHLDLGETGDLADALTLNAQLGNGDWHNGFQFASVEQAAATYAFAAFDPSIADNNGSFTLESRVADPATDPIKPWARDIYEARKLWTLSEKLIGQEFSYEKERL